MSDEIDPEIAALLGTGPAPRPRREERVASMNPDFDSLFGGAGVVVEERSKAGFGVDLSQARTAPVVKDEESVPGDFFSDPDFYRKALAAEGEESRNSTPCFPSIYSPRTPRTAGSTVSRSYRLTGTSCTRWPWNALPGLPRPETGPAAVRVLLPTLLSPERQDMIQRVVHKKELDEPFYYLDEWLRAVALGHVGQSATDEVKSRSRRTTVPGSTPYCRGSRARRIRRRDLTEGQGGDPENPGRPPAGPAGPAHPARFRDAGSSSGPVY
ncbi:MAG: hypothetical protein MZV70_22305 [Desulfobacterales bacterium]|nr:hypothetical protein [Desulfobacterales bacterium]